jgi:hypothetical protein
MKVLKYKVLEINDFCAWQSAFCYGLLDEIRFSDNKIDMLESRAIDNREQNL